MQWRGRGDWVEAPGCSGKDSAGRSPRSSEDIGSCSNVLGPCTRQGFVTCRAFCTKAWQSLRGLEPLPGAGHPAPRPAWMADRWLRGTEEEGLVPSPGRSGVHTPLVGGTFGAPTAEVQGTPSWDPKYSHAAVRGPGPSSGRELRGSAWACSLLRLEQLAWFSRGGGTP